MAINYPTSLDTFTNPTASDLLTLPSHAQQHSDINDAVEALQTKVAIGNTVLGTYTAYTPTIANFTIGNGTIATQYCRVNNFVHYFGTITLGSTSVAGPGMYNTLPITADSAFNDAALGTGFVLDASTGVKYIAIVRLANSTNAYWNFTSDDFSGYPRARNASSINPMTWTTSDSWFFNITYKAA